MVQAVNLIVTDIKTLPLANRLESGVSLVEPDPKRLLDWCFERNLKSLTYLKNVADPGMPDGLNEDSFPVEVLLMKELSLMSDMWDIPLVVVVQGGHRVAPQTAAGVWWAMLEDAITARKSRILRVNGLFGPSIHNDVWNALGAEKPTFDSRWQVNPLHEDQLINEIQSPEWESRYGTTVLLGGEPAGTWLDMVSLVLPSARGWDPSVEKRDVRRSSSYAAYERSRIWNVQLARFDPSWEATSAGPVLPSLHRDPFAALAELAMARGHEVDYPNPPEATDCA
jgi:hypothetical protein